MGATLVEFLLNGMLEKDNAASTIDITALTFKIKLIATLVKRAQLREPIHM